MPCKCVCSCACIRRVVLVMWYFSLRFPCLSLVIGEFRLVYVNSKVGRLVTSDNLRLFTRPFRSCKHFRRSNLKTCIIEYACMVRWILFITFCKCFMKELHSRIRILWKFLKSCFSNYLFLRDPYTILNIFVCITISKLNILIFSLYIIYVLML